MRVAFVVDPLGSLDGTPIGTVIAIRRRRRPHRAAVGVGGGVHKRQSPVRAACAGVAGVRLAPALRACGLRLTGLDVIGTYALGLALTVGVLLPPV